jgi:hypothetical protein
MHRSEQVVKEVRRDEVAGPFRLLMRIPVPWVFVLTYLIGVALEPVWPRAWVRA